MRITVVMASMLATSLAGCSKPVTEAKAPAPPAAVAAPVRDAATPCTLTPTNGQEYTMKVTPSFHVTRIGKQVNPNKPNPNPGQLDTYTNLKDGEMATITISLNGTLKFQPNPFQLKDPAGPMIFCGLTNTDTTLTFYTFRQNGLPYSSAYSLAVLVPDPQNKTEALKVIIDPIVDNDGVIVDKLRVPRPHGGPLNGPPPPG